MKTTKSEQRRYRRIPLDLPARIIVNGIDEYDGRLLNISPGDLSVVVDARIVKGDAAVIYVSGLDVIEGRVARTFPDGFALSFLLSRRRRALLTEQLMLRANPNFSASFRSPRRAPPPDRRPAHGVPASRRRIAVRSRARSIR